MKQKVIYILIICFMCTTLTACQPTPQDNAVVNKNKGVLEEKINKEASSTPSFDIPENINETVYTEDGKLSIQINAGVEKLTLPEYPVYSIAPADFSQEEVDTVIKYFFKDIPLYAQNYTKSKSMINDEIVRLRAELQKMNPSDTDDVETAEAAIKQLEKAYESAPENVTRTQITSKLSVPSDVNYGTLDAFADLGYTELSSISVSNRPIFQSMFVILDKGRYFLSSASLAGKNAEGQKMTLDEAKLKAEAALDDMKIEGMTAVKIETGMTEDQSRQGYVVTFCRSVNGVSVAYNTIISNAEREDLAAKWSSDRIIVCLDDKGISAFNWLSKGKIQQVMTKNVEMISFAEIMDIARQQLKNKFAWIDPNENSDSAKTDVNIENIVLEYTCAQQKDNPDNYLLIPAWNFYVNSKEAPLLKKFYCVLSLNAVDGSVIG